MKLLWLLLSNSLRAVATSVANMATKEQDIQTTHHAGIVKGPVIAEILMSYLRNTRLR